MFALHKAQCLKKMVCILAILSIGGLGLVNLNANLRMYYLDISQNEVYQGAAQHLPLNASAAGAGQKLPERLATFEAASLAGGSWLEHGLAPGQTAITLTELGAPSLKSADSRQLLDAIVAPSLLPAMLYALRVQTNQDIDRQASFKRRLRDVFLASASIGIAGVLGAICITIGLLGILTSPLFNALGKSQRRLDARKTILLAKQAGATVRKSVTYDDGSSGKRRKLDNVVS